MERIKNEIKILADEKQNRQVIRRLKEALRRMKEALTRNPELCPSVITPVGKKEGEEIGI
ncbi:hypothetical protein H5U35_06980 [Candidatus Aerophobetes bacterium]|nr:hypothetical protein [Candidatus Aerophobetes bacterium]